MNNIQKLISELEDEKSKAIKLSSSAHKKGLELVAANITGAASAFDLCIQKLKLLLSEQPGAITEDSHFCKHEVGRSAASDDISNKGTAPSESSSETQAVGQNEQTKEVCPEQFCDAPVHHFGNIWLCDRGHRGVL